MKLDRATGKCIYSAPCGMSGCIDYNINIDEAFAAYNKESGGQFDGDTADEVAVFRFGDGKVFSIGCECEIRGGGGLISPLHIHHCHLHGGKTSQAANAASGRERKTMRKLLLKALKWLVSFDSSQDPKGPDEWEGRSYGGM